MLIKIYWSTWGLYALAALILFATGNLTMLSIVWLGFVALGLVFMGMMGVLPTMVHQQATAPVSKPRPVAIQATRETSTKGFRILKAA